MKFFIPHFNVVFVFLTEVLEDDTSRWSIHWRVEVVLYLCLNISLYESCISGSISQHLRRRCWHLRLMTLFPQKSINSPLVSGPTIYLLQMIAALWMRSYDYPHTRWQLFVIINMDMFDTAFSFCNYFLCERILYLHCSLIEPLSMQFWEKKVYA